MTINLTINTSGTITVSGTVNYYTGTLSYVTGTVTTTGSTLNLGTSTTLNTGSLVWNNVATHSYPINTTSTYTLNSDFHAAGNLVINSDANSANTVFNG